MKFQIIVAILLMTLQSVAQKEDLIKFLDAYKTIEFSESQSIIKDYSFDVDNDYIISDYTTITDLKFATDFPKITGYKAIVICKVKDKEGNLVEKRVLFVLYYDFLKKHYSVLGFRNAADAKYEFEQSKLKVESGNFYTDKEYVYRNVAYWALLSGNLKESKKYIDLAISYAKENNRFAFKTDNIDIALKRITNPNIKFVDIIQ